MPGISDSGWEHCREQTNEPQHRSRHGPSLSATVLHGTDESEAMTIMTTYVTCGPRRVLVGFRIMMRPNGSERRTENRCSSTKQDPVEWGGPNPILSVLSAVIRVAVRPLFELKPVLGAGKQPRELMVTVKLLSRSATLAFFLKDRDSVHPYPAFFVRVKQQDYENRGPSTSRVLRPLFSTGGRLDDAINKNRSSLSHYRMHGNKQYPVAKLQRALRICTLDHSHLAAPQSSTVMGKERGLIERHGNQAATYVPQLQAKHRVGTVQLHRSLIEQGTTPRFQTHEGLQIFSVWLVERFERLGDLDSLGQAITVLKELSRSTSIRDYRKHVWLGNLGVALSLRFKRLGELRDLEDAISTLRAVSVLIPRRHPNRSACLNNLGSSLFTRFKRFGKRRDLETSISTIKRTIDLTPHGHPDKLGYLNNLGIFLRTRFKCLGELRDLEDAISTLKAAANLVRHGHPHMPTCLNNLGASFFTRFKHFGELSDLEASISTLKHAVDLTPYCHPDKPARLNNLGISFRIRFRHLRELNDLESAISALKTAVHLAPHGHSYKVACLNNLGNSLFTRFKRLGELRDLEDAISTIQDVVNFTPDGYPDKPGRLNNLGIAFFTRFQHLGEPNDLELAILRQRDAVSLTPHGHIDRSISLNNLGTFFKTRFDYFGEPNDLELAISLFSHAASSPFGSIRVRFYAAKKWISCARRARHRSLLHAYSVTINLLPQLAWIGLSLSRRYSQLMRAADVVREAAAAALDSGLPEIAVEWLEQGRSIVWGDLFQLRSSYEELSSAYPDHARRLQELSVALDHAGVIREQSLPALSERIAHRAPPSLQLEADWHRKLAIERDKLLQEIRRLPGFERFLLQKEFPRLRTLAHVGPVVILNAAESRCDALIILADVDHAIHVPLPNFTFKRSADLQKIMKGFVRLAREGKRLRDGVGLEYILPPLWKCVVKPVLDALAFSTPGDVSRIFWCPTGPFTFLPIHAAGLYGTNYSQPGHKVFDFVISSYVPTLTVLAPSPNRITTPSNNLRLFVVPQPASDGLSQLRGVATELKYIGDIIGSSPSTCTTLVTSSAGTVEEVLDLMKEADWVHFACHGVQDRTNPTNSGLCLADRRRLKLQDIIGLSRPRGGLAFLSACQTAMGEERLSDEAIHVAAGMLFAGYGGVIGTMWSISDSLAPVVAREVYERLYRKGTRPDYRDAARALHEAMGRVRESGIASFDEWLPFVHVGL